MNRTMLIGRLVKDPELRHVGQDIQLTNFTIAINRQHKKEETDYFDIVAWRKLAELCEKYLIKGQKAAIEGRLEQQKWEKNGKKFSKVVIVADNVQFLEKPQGKQGEEFDPEDVPF